MEMMTEHQIFSGHTFRQANFGVLCWGKWQALCGMICGPSNQSGNMDRNGTPI